MKQIIKIKMLEHTILAPKIVNDGDWIDLRAAKDIKLNAPYTIPARKNQDRKVIFNDTVIPLGIAMQLPKGYEAIVNPRSSSYKNFSIILGNGQGVIDNTYCGNDDQWFAHVIALKGTTIKKGDRICQFRIQLSQKATFIQKLKWLFSSGIKIKFVSNLNNKNRGGHGHSGIN